MPNRDAPLTPGSPVVHLRAAGCSLVIEVTGPSAPRILHWGGDLGDLPQDELAALASAARPPVATNALDDPVPVGILLQHAAGWPGLPGLSGHRGGRDWSPSFVLTDASRAEPDPPIAGGNLTVHAKDPAASLSLVLVAQMSDSGLVRMRAAVRNDHPDSDYTIDGLVLAFPVPLEAAELLDLTGRHCRERSPQRQPFAVGSRMRDSRRGRTGADATLVLAAGTPCFSFRSGEVWGIHVAWSGNHRTYAERLPSGVGVLGGGELLLPGEMRLSPGAMYESPWIYGAYGHGLDELSERFYSHLRGRPTHPGPDRARLVVLNTWEAVYFEHDQDRLKELAERAAEIGVERFVLDDGWFRGRRDDSAGLGDWYVDEEVYPKGLHPLVDHVRDLGMQFGLWVEPEMVNPDSDLARAHPDWILATGGRTPPASRRQQVLDLSNPEAYAYLLERLDALLGEYEISYLKWDHNRDLVDAGRSSTGEPGVHLQTLAVYRLLDELKSGHPSLEIESCSSGGARIDLGILEHTDRVWASDTNDALERQSIQRWTGLLLPPELVGAHVGPPRAHTTGRTHDLAFRAGTALFGHFGIEWDLCAISDAERLRLKAWVDTYKELRRLIHSGRVVRVDHPDPAVWVHGIVAADNAEAIFAIVAISTGLWASPGRIRLPGLDPETTYHIRPLIPDGEIAALGIGAPPWLLEGGVTLSGRAVAEAGIQAPSIPPEMLLLLHVQRRG